MTYNKLLDLCNEFNFRINENQIWYDSNRLESVGCIEQNRNKCTVYTQPFMNTPINNIKKLKQIFDMLCLEFKYRKLNNRLYKLEKDFV